MSLVDLIHSLHDDARDGVVSTSTFSRCNSQCFILVFVTKENITFIQVWSFVLYWLCSWLLFFLTIYPRCQEVLAVAPCVRDVYACVRPDGKNMSLPHVSLSISQHMGFCCDNLRNYYGFTSHGGVLTVPRKNYICCQQHNKSSALCEITWPRNYVDC